MTTIDLRRQRGVRNREALLASALSLFAAQGYESTTVEQIAADAGVSPRTFFHHFAAKEDVLFDGYAERLADVVHQFRARAADGSLWDALVLASRSVAQAIEEQPQRFLERSRLYAEVPGLRATMLRINEDWIDEMTAEIGAAMAVDPARDVRPRLLATFVNGANRSALEVWVGSGATIDLGALMAECLDLLRPTVAQVVGPDGAPGAGGGR